MRVFQLPETGKKFIITLLEMSVDAGLEFLKTQLSLTPIIVPDISIVRTLCSLLLAHLNIVSENGGFGTCNKIIQLQMNHFLESISLRLILIKAAPSGVFN